MSNPFLTRIQKDLDTPEVPVTPPNVIDNSKGPVLNGHLKPSGEPIDDLYKNVKPNSTPTDYGIVTKDENGNTRIKYQFPINMLDNSGDTSLQTDIPDYLVGKKVRNPLQHLWKMTDGDTDVNRIKFLDAMDDEFPGFNKTTLEDADFFIGKHNWFGAKNVFNGLDTYNELAMALLSMGYNKALNPEAREKFEATDTFAYRSPNMGQLNFNPTTGLKHIDNPIAGPDVNKDPLGFTKIDDQSVKIAQDYFKAIAKNDKKKLENAEELFFKPLRDNFQKRSLTEQIFISLWADPILGKTIGIGGKLMKRGSVSISNKVIKARGGKALNLTYDLSKTIDSYADTEINLIKIFGQDKIINQTFDLSKIDQNVLPGMNLDLFGALEKQKVLTLFKNKKIYAEKLEELAKKQNKSIEDTYEHVNDVFQQKTLADDTKAFEELKELNIVDPVPFFESKINAIRNLDPNSVRGRANVLEESKKLAADSINKDGGNIKLQIRKL